MDSLTKHPASMIVLTCLCLAACIMGDSASPQRSSTLPPELSIEEHKLEEGPELEPLTFVPAGGTQEEVLSRHEAKRATSARTPCHGECEASRGSERLVASLTVTATREGDQKVFVDVVRNGETIYSAELGDACVVPPLWGLWTYEDHWVLEAAHVEARREGGAIHCYPTSQIIEDGKSLNKLHGYEESFGFQLMNGKPFYFFKRENGVGASYDGQEIPLGYTHISHYQCCSGAAANLRSSGSMVAFFAQRDGARYYVEIGVFE